MNSLAVVILNYNGIKLLEKFLPNVVDYSPEAHVVIIDNASTCLLYTSDAADE